MTKLFLFNAQWIAVKRKKFEKMQHILELELSISLF